MQRIKPLAVFFKAIEKDARISITHIGIYAALLQCWQAHGCRNPVSVYSYEVMRVAKISGTATWHKCVRDLHEFGYIRYEPSFKRNRRSKVYLLTTGTSLVNN
jgi:hypothetical protein